MDDKRSLTSDESLSLIRSMIDKARTDFRTQLLLFAAAANLITYLIPGYLLKSNSAAS